MLFILSHGVEKYKCFTINEVEATGFFLEEFERSDNAKKDAAPKHYNYSVKVERNPSSVI